MLSQRGGLRLLLLDDPQELLDAENRERLADALPELIDVGGQLLVTTLDRKFARFATLAARRAGIAGVEHRAVFPVTTLRQTVETPLAVDCLEDKRRTFLRPEHADVARFAQDYAAEVRVFVEARLAALFDDPAYATSLDPPMLGDLLGRLRSKVNLPASDFFGSPIVVDFARHLALAPGCACLKVLQRAHHGDKDSISYIDVDAVKDDLHSVCVAANEVHEEFRRWRQRHPARPATTTAVTPPPMARPTFAVEIHRDLAAFTGTTAARMGVIPEDQISGTWFAGKALFYVRSDSFGFAAPAGSIAIIEVDSAEVEDKRLVIARWGTKILARRLARSGEDRTRVGLVAQAPNPLKSPPSLIVSVADVQIFRVVGILLDDHGLPPHGSREEAVLISEAPVLDRVEAAFRVAGNSALPLALPNQIVLGGAALTAEELGRHEGKLVALALADGSAVLKRIGGTLPAPFAHVRLFESVGFGESLLIRTEELESEGSRYPLIVGARLVVGVLYTAG